MSRTINGGREDRKAVAGNTKQFGWGVRRHVMQMGEGQMWAHGIAPGNVGLWVNLEGVGMIQAGARSLICSPQKVFWFIHRDSVPIETRRLPGRHRIMIIELEEAFFTMLSGTRQGGRGSSITPIWELPWSEAIEELAKACFEVAENHFGVAEYVFRILREIHGDRGNGNGTDGDTRVRRMKEILNGALAQPLDLQEVSRAAGCTPEYACALFRKREKRTMSQYLRRARLARACRLLGTSRKNILEVALECGYSSPSHFSNIFRQSFGCSPTVYRMRVMQK